MITLFRRGKVYWIRYRAGGVQHRESLRTENRKLAEELRRHREAALLLAEHQVTLGLPSFATAAAPAAPAAAPRPREAAVRAEYAEWSKAYKRPKTILNDTMRLRVFFQHAAVAHVDDVTTAHVERFIAKQAGEGKTPATILRHREILHAFFKWAERCGFVEKNPVAGTRRPRLPARDPRFLSIEQIDEVLKVVEGQRVAPVVATAICAGLRREELCWLTWSDLELDAEPAMLRVRAKVVDGESWETKTKRDRKVPISSRLLPVLRAHRAAHRRKDCPWVFESPEGLRWDPDNLGRELRAVLNSKGLRWNFLDMRHTFGSQLARRNVSLVKIAKLMGNSPQVAQMHYVNLVAEDLAVDVDF